jgi:hypothetical protein
MKVDEVQDKMKGRVLEEGSNIKKEINAFLHSLEAFLDYISEIHDNNPSSMF